MKKENGEARTYVLDSSAFLTMFEDEDGADVVQEILEKPKERQSLSSPLLQLLLGFSISFKLPQKYFTFFSGKQIHPRLSACICVLLFF